MLSLVFRFFCLKNGKLPKSATKCRKKRSLVAYFVYKLNENNRFGGCFALLMLLNWLKVGIW
jgi:hypothetical protein